MSGRIQSAEQRLYERLGMENPNKPQHSHPQPVEGKPQRAIVRIAVRGEPVRGKVPPPVAAKPSRAKVLTNKPKPMNEEEHGKPQENGSSVQSQAKGKTNQTLLDELDLLTDLLVKNLEHSDDPDFFGMCYKCGHKVSGEGNGCTAMGNVYHIECFVCGTCSVQMTGKEFFCVDNIPYCESCYMATLEECVICSKKITERILRAVNNAYHPECFNCSSCDKNLDNVPFTLDATSQVHCVECYQMRFSPRCASCQKLILPENEKGETVHIVSMQKNFHVNCYRCEDCDMLLSSEEGRGCFPLDGHLLCQTCNGKRVQNISNKVEPTTEL